MLTAKEKKTRKKTASRKKPASKKKVEPGARKMDRISLRAEAEDLSKLHDLSEGITTSAQLGRIALRLGLRQIELHGIEYSRDLYREIKREWRANRGEGIV